MSDEDELKKIKQTIAKNEAKFSEALKDVTEIEYKQITYNQPNSLLRCEVGSLVSIRPCAEEYKDKTFLGIFLGDLPIGFYSSINNNILTVETTDNPAIYIPDIKKIIFGYDSWWGIIKDENHLKQITNNDINNIWYVKALKELTDRRQTDS